MISITDLNRELLIASNEGDTTFVLRCIFAGADVNVIFPGPDVTPLHFAAARGFYEIALILLANGADRIAVDNEGYTPSEYAFMNGHYEIYKMIISWGIDANEIYRYRQCRNNVS